jgi:hypothetical protein
MDLYDEEMEGSNPRSESGEDEGTTGLLPVGFFKDKSPQPGDICSVEVVKIYDDQVEVRYVSHGEDESMEEESPEQSMPSPEMEDEMMA